MKAIVVTRFEGADALELHDVHEPSPSQNEVLVNVEAVGVNFADVRGAMGLYPGGPKPPYIAGREFAGTLAGTGQPVMGYTQQGACAARIAIHRDFIWPQPHGWNSILSAAFPVNYFTAWLVYWKAGVIQGITTPDKTPVSSRTPTRILIHAAAGGVGTAAVQLGRLMGFETFGTASSDEKLERLRALGLNHAINYTREDYEQKVKELTSGEGVDVVFESLAGEHTAKSLRCCAYLGRVVLFGSSTGERPKFDTLAMYERSLSAHGLWLSRLARNRALIDQAMAWMQPWIDSGKLQPVIGAKFPLEAAADAFRLLAGRKSFGKVVLTV
jgi:NADPH2:quinone reductase